MPPILFLKQYFFLSPFPFSHIFYDSFLQPTLEMPWVTSQTYAARITIYYPAFAW